MTEGGRIILLFFAAAAAGSDIRRGKISNFLILLMLAAGIGWRIAGIGWRMVCAPESLPGIAGAMALTLAVLVPFWRPGGLGAGDIKLLAALVPFLGVQWYIVSIILSFLIGAVFSAVLLIRYRDLSRTIHFAVPVCISVTLCLLLQQLGIQSTFLLHI